MLLFNKNAWNESCDFLAVPRSVVPSREVFHNRIKLAQMVKPTGNTLCSNLIPTSRRGVEKTFGDFKFRLR